jgi:hypothetical protein
MDKERARSVSKLGKLSNIVRIFLIIASDVVACVSVAESIKCLLGPKSLQKLFVNDSSILLTNDGATALNAMVCKY